MSIWTLHIPEPVSQPQRASADEQIGYVSFAAAAAKGMSSECNGIISVSPTKFSRLLAMYQSGKKPSRMNWIVGGTTELPAQMVATQRMDIA